MQIQFIMFKKLIQLKIFFLIFFLFFSILGGISIDRAQAGCCYCIRDTDNNPCPNTSIGGFSRCWATDTLQDCMNNISSGLYGNQYIWGWDGTQSQCNENPYGNEYPHDDCQRHYYSASNGNNNNGTAASSSHGLVPCGRNQGTPEEMQPCTLCHLVVGVQRIINWLMHVLTYLAIAALVAAGIFYIVSAGNEKMLEMAKSYIKYILLGFGVALAAWVLVNYTLYLFSATSQEGGFIRGLSSGEHWWEFECNTTSNLGGGGGPTPPTPPPTPPPPGSAPTMNGYILSPADISNPTQQRNDASSDLINLLNCMRDRLPEEARVLSSISDSQGISNCINDYDHHNCAHGRYSCHYGGRNCRGEMKSYAVDFKYASYRSQITEAANSCGADSIFDEGNHIHVSVSNNRCGCDRRRR